MNSNISLSESLSGYLTAEEDADETQYLSVLNPDISYENVDGTLSQTYEKETQSFHQSEEPFIFTVDGTNEIYGIQTTLDENGQLQKYQIQYLENENGELVPLIETIQLLPLEDEFNEINEIDVTPTNGILGLAGDHNMKFTLSCNEENVNIDSNEETENDKFTYDSTESDKPELISFISKNLIEKNKMCILKNMYEDISVEPSCETEHLNDSVNENECNEDEEFIIENSQNENSTNTVTNNVNIESNISLINEDINNSADETYQEVEEMQLAEGQIIPKETVEHHTKTNILKKSPCNKVQTIALDDKVIYVETITEKENIEFGRIQKTSSRSLLKCNQPSQSLLPKLTSTRVPREEIVENKTLKRFPRTKEAKQARQFMNFINSTTIIQAPERKERLPRKQQIKPVEHPNEDIVVKEMIVASNNFVEPITEEEKRYLPISEYVELIDSDDETNNVDGRRKKKNRKNNRTIEISDSDESDVLELEHNKNRNKNGTIRKKRGRPPKSRIDETEISDTNLESPPKISRLGNEVEDVTTNLETIKVDNASSSNQSIPLTTSINEVRENSENKKKTNISKLKKPIQGVKKKEFDYKYECEKCKSKFINRILLGRHECTKKKNSSTLHKKLKKVQPTNLSKSNIPIPMSSTENNDKSNCIKCDQCDIRFQRKSEWFHHHIQNHNNETSKIEIAIVELTKTNAQKSIPINKIKRNLNQI